jgi:hypothetical protein
MMRMAGFFPSVPTQVNFDLIYAPVNGQWRLFGIAVNLGSSAPVPPAPPPNPAAKNETKSDAKNAPKAAPAAAKPAAPPASAPAAPAPAAKQ